MTVKAQRPPARTLRWLRYDEQLTYAAIGKRYGRAASTVKKWFDEIEGRDGQYNADTSIPRAVSTRKGR